MQQQNVTPEHIAIIMDGNGRWAHDRGLPRAKGHEQGAQSVRKITEHCARVGVKELTLFAFSMENWKRPKAEVRTLMSLLRKFLVGERETICKNDLVFRAIGRLEGLSAAVRDELDATIEASADNGGMILRLALNYGGRGEIVDAMKKIGREIAAGAMSADDVDESVVQRYLYDSSMTPPDLLIRTAGEYRISNFLLWQISYSEIYVTERCWPDFGEADLDAALRSYEGRVRKFGGLEPSRC